MYTCVCVCVRRPGERELPCIHVYVFVLGGQERERDVMYTCVCARRPGERELPCIHVYVFVLRGQERESFHVYMCMSLC